MLISMASAGLLGAPVYLRNNDGVSVYHGYLIVEVIDFISDWMDCCTDDSLKDWVGRIPIKNAVHFVADAWGIDYKYV